MQTSAIPDQRQPGHVSPLHVTPLIKTVDYQHDPLRVFHTLSSSGSEHILLESAEIDSKAKLKSLLLIDPALKLVCRNQTVQVSALSHNGEQVLDYLQARLPDSFQTVRRQRQLTIECLAPQAGHTLTEDERLRAPGNLTALRLLQQIASTGQHPFALTLAGAFGFDLIASFEALPEVKDGLNSCPDYQFYLAETLLIIDHEKRHSELIGSLFSGQHMQTYSRQLSRRMDDIAQKMLHLSELSVKTSVSAKPYNSAVDFAEATPDRATFMEQVSQLQNSINAGDIFQVVPSRQFTMPCHNPLAAYQQLKRDNPSPYMFYLQTAEFTLFGASPESALKYQAANRQIELYPIAGTRIRGRHPNGQINPDLDSRIELELRHDSKEVAEHMMLVDLARNDLARVAVSGSRYVADLLKVDRYSQVMHLVSRVVATLRPELDALDAYRACMNMGTLTGAPKLSATQLIRHTEQQRRGSYGGAVGYLTGEGDMDTCIVIRSAFVRDNLAVVQAGAGVVYDSDPASECAETEHKARAVIAAIQRVEEAL